MNWACPHLENDFCKKLKTICQPTQKGCELHGKVRVSVPAKIKDKNSEKYNGSK